MEPDKHPKINEQDQTIDFMTRFAVFKVMVPLVFAIILMLQLI
jgi:hypothetical protein